MTPRFEHQSVQSFPVFRTLHEPRKNWLEKLLSLFADVREALILTEGGAEVKSYSAAAQAVLLAFIVPVYGAFASRVPG